MRALLAGLLNPVLLWASGWMNDRLQVFDSSGVFLRKWGS